MDVGRGPASFTSTLALRWNLKVSRVAGDVHDWSCQGAPSPSPRPRSRSSRPCPFTMKGPFGVRIASAVVSTSSRMTARTRPLRTRAVMSMGGSATPSAEVCPSPNTRAYALIWPASTVAVSTCARRPVPDHLRQLGQEQLSSHFTSAGTTTFSSTWLATGSTCPSVVATALSTFTISRCGPASTHVARMSARAWTSPSAPRW